MQAAAVAFRSTSVMSTSAHLLSLIKAAPSLHQQLVWMQERDGRERERRIERNGNMTWLCNLFQPVLHPILQTNTGCLWSSLHCHWCIFHEGIHCLPLILWHFGAAVEQSISSNYHLYSPNYTQHKDLYDSNVVCFMAQSSSRTVPPDTVKEIQFRTNQSAKSWFLRFRANTGGAGANTVCTSLYKLFLVKWSTWSW